MNKKVLVLIILISSIILSMLFIQESFCVNIKPYNEFIDDKNDPNFQSDVMNTNIFVRNPEHVQNIFKSIKNTPKQRISYQDEWLYKDEFVMNGGVLFNQVKGYDARYPYSDSYYTDQNIESLSCDPKKRGTQNDDIRMGLGLLQAQNRLIR